MPKKSRDEFSETTRHHLTERSHYDNGMWLCAAHAPLIDHDWPRYSIDERRAIKHEAEAKAAANLEQARQPVAVAS